MTLLAQHGYGKSDKIELGIRNGSLSGVVLSPRDLSPEAMTDFVARLREEFSHNIEILLDPQFYASVIDEATDRNLPDYPYYTPGLRRSDFLSAKAITKFVEDALQYQYQLDLSRAISPTIAFDSFAEPASQTALQLAAEAVGYHNEIASDRPLLVSFTIGESALSDKDGIDEFLDIASSWDAEGYYLIAELSDQTYPSTLNSERLANLMYIVYTLSIINRYQVYVGYSDFSGLLLRATGATAQSTGWFGGLRQFSRQRWKPSTGGSAARPRYSSAPLLNSILLIPELSAAHQAGLTDLCLSSTKFDELLISQGPASADWKLPTQCLHHWLTLSSLHKLMSENSTKQNLETLGSFIASAADHYNELSTSGVTFERPSGPSHLSQWSEAISLFSKRAQL